jgi:hypothetical protein
MTTLVLLSLVGVIAVGMRKLWKMVNRHRGSNVPGLNSPPEATYKVDDKTLWQFSEPTSKMLDLFAALYPEKRRLYKDTEAFRKHMREIYVAGEISELISERLPKSAKSEGTIPKLRSMPEDARKALRVEAERQQLRRLEEERAYRATADRLLSDEVIGSAINALLDRQADTIHQFLRLAERKVGTLDDYGDENWSALPSEIQRCVQKVSEREKATLVETPSGERLLSFNRGPATGSLEVLRAAERQDFDRRLHQTLVQVLEQRFRTYHRQHADCDTPRSEVAAMRGVEFENYLMRVLRNQGFSVQGTRATGDSGADIVAAVNDRVLVIQAKGVRQSVGVEAVQEVAAALPYYRGTEAWVITNSTFTAPAVQLAQANNVRLVSGAEIARLGQILSSGRSAMAQRELF